MNKNDFTRKERTIINGIILRNTEIHKNNF